MGILGYTPVQTTYSFKDLTLTLNNPALDTPIQLAGGNIGTGALTVRMATERTKHLVGADGVVMPSYVAGDNGELSIEMQQTSALHHALLTLYNLLITLAANGDVSNWANTTIAGRTVLDGATHVFSGVSFQKIPDKPYESEGRNVTWILMAANIVNL